MTKPRLVFAPGCFDNFDGTQEELDAFMAELERLLESGELLENSVPLETLEDEEQSLVEDLISQEPRRLH